MFGGKKGFSDDDHNKLYAAGLAVLTCDPSNRLRDTVEHIDKDLSALVFGLWCFIWGWLIFVCFVRT